MKNRWCSDRSEILRSGRRNPNLVPAEVEIIHDNKVIDRTTHSFGIRTIAFNSNDGFLLNGVPVILNGGCVHHDNGSLGAAAYDRAEERKVELLKAAGFNAVRTAHNPPSEAFLDACDRLGLLVIDEAFDGWKASKNSYDYSTFRCVGEARHAGSGAARQEPSFCDHVEHRERGD